MFWRQRQVTEERDGEGVTRTIPLLQYFKAIFPQVLAVAESAGVYFVQPVGLLGWAKVMLSKDSAGSAMIASIPAV